MSYLVVVMEEGGVEGGQIRLAEDLKEIRRMGRHRKGESFGCQCKERSIQLCESERDEGRREGKGGSEGGGVGSEGGPLMEEGEGEGVERDGKKR